MTSTHELLAPLFDRLDARDELREEERQALRDRAGPPRRLAAGTDMVKDGDVVTTSTLVTSGFAIRYRLMGEGGRQIMAIHVPATSSTCTASCSSAWTMRWDRSAAARSSRSSIPALPN